MKYERSMTEYNEIVGASIYRLVGEEAEKLREADIILSAVSRVLKAEHGASYHGCTGEGGIAVKSSPSGMEIDLSPFYPNIKDSKLTLTWSDVAKLIKDDSFYADHIHAYKRPEKRELLPAHDEAAAVKHETSPALFDYGELNETEADKLRKIELTIKTETASYFTILGANFKAAQELLSNHSGGTFERWYTAMGFKRQTVYNLIQRYDFLCSPTVGGQEADVFEELPLALSYEISKPSAPPELVEQVLSGDITTNAEYQKLLKEKRALEERCEQLAAETDSGIATIKEQDEKIADLKRLVCNLNDDYNKALKEKIDANKQHEAEKRDFERKVKDLESRPVETAVQIVEKIPDNYVTLAAMESAVQRERTAREEAEDDYIKLKREYNTTETELKQEIERLGKALEERNSAPAQEGQTNSTVMFNAYLTSAYDAINRLVKYINEQKNSTYAKKAITLIDSVKTSLEGAE